MLSSQWPYVVISDVEERLFEESEVSNYLQDHNPDVSLELEVEKRGEYEQYI